MVFQIVFRIAVSQTDPEWDPGCEKHSSKGMNESIEIGVVRVVALQQELWPYNRSCGLTTGVVAYNKSCGLQQELCLSTAAPIHV